MSERLSAEELAEIRQTHNEGGDDAMHCICSEYQCPCHRAIPALLAHISVLEAELQEAREQAIGIAAEIRRAQRAEDFAKSDLAVFRTQLVAAVRAQIKHDTDCFKRTHNGACDCPEGGTVEEVVALIEQFNAGEL